MSFDDARGAREYVLGVPLAGGPVATIAEGRDPAISPDGRLLATASARDAARIWDVATGTQVCHLAGRVDAVAFSPGGRLLATAGAGDVARLWDIATNEIMDKDRFGRNLGQVEEAYQEVARRLGILPEGDSRDMKGPAVMQ